MEDEYLAGMGIGTIRVLNAEDFAYGDLDIELEVLKRLEANGLVKIIQERRERYSGMRVLTISAYSKGKRHISRLFRLYYLNKIKRPHPL